jgi:hypothetical protein
MPEEWKLKAELVGPPGQPGVKGDIGELTESSIATYGVVRDLDKKALPTQLAGTWRSLPRSSGYMTGFFSPSNKMLFGINLDGDVVGRFIGTDTTSTLMKIPDMLQEWWSQPANQWHDGWLSTCGIGEFGDVIVADWNERTGGTAIKIGQAGRDDHNAPARWTEPGRGSLATWSNHGVTNNLEVVAAPGSGTVESFVGRPVVSIPIGAPVSYSDIQLRAHLRTANTDTFWIILRNDSNWGVREIVVDWSTGIVTWPGAYKRMIAFTEQPYVTTNDGGINAAGNPCVRMAVGYNPSAARHEIYFLQLDLVTGILTSPNDPSINHNIAGGTYLADTAIAPVMSNTATGSTRRLFYVRPASAGPGWAVLTSEYSLTSPTTGLYTETVYAPGGNTTRTFGTTGASFGGSTDSNYVGGINYNALGKIYVCRKAGTIWTLEREDGTILKRSNTALVRPFPLVGAKLEVIYSSVPIYGATYFIYRGNLEGI